MSLRMGFYTGTVYNDNYDKLDDIKECCAVLTDEQIEFINKGETHKRLHAEYLHLRCINCNGCPLSQEVTNES